MPAPPRHSPAPRSCAWGELVFAAVRLLWASPTCLSWSAALEELLCAPCCRAEPGLGRAAAALESLYRTEWWGGRDVCREEPNQGHFCETKPLVLSDQYTAIQTFL